MSLLVLNRFKNILPINYSNIFPTEKHSIESFGVLTSFYTVGRALEATSKVDCLSLLRHGTSKLTRCLSEIDADLVRHHFLFFVLNEKHQQHFHEFT